MAAESVVLRDVEVTRESDWVTVRLPIVQRHSFDIEANVPAVSIECGGLLDGRPAGFLATLVMKWEPQMHEGVPFAFWWSEMAFERIGEPSDYFVQQLGKLFNVAGRAESARSRVIVTAVSIAEEPKSESEKISLKVFFEPENPDKYAEMYFSIDWRNSVVELSEKDPEYREAIVRALSNDGKEHP